MDREAVTVAVSRKKRARESEPGTPQNTPKRQRLTSDSKVSNLAHIQTPKKRTESSSTRSTPQSVKPRASTKRKSKSSRKRARQESEENLWSVSDILCESTRDKKRSFLVVWAGTDPVSGQPWDHTYEPAENLGDELFRGWDLKKAAISTVTSVKAREEAARRTIHSYLAGVGVHTAEYEIQLKAGTHNKSILAQQSAWFTTADFPAPAVKRYQRKVIPSDGSSSNVASPLFQPQSDPSGSKLGTEHTTSELVGSTETPSADLDSSPKTPLPEQTIVTIGESPSRSQLPEVHPPPFPSQAEKYRFISESQLPKTPSSISLEDISGSESVFFHTPASSVPERQIIPDSQSFLENSLHTQSQSEIQNSVSVIEKVTQDPSIADPVSKSANNTDIESSASAAASCVESVRSSDSCHQQSHLSLAPASSDQVGQTYLGSSFEVRRRNSLGFTQSHHDQKDSSRTPDVEIPKTSPQRQECVTATSNVSVAIDVPSNSHSLQSITQALDLEDFASQIPYIQSQQISKTVSNHNLSFTAEDDVNSEGSKVENIAESIEALDNSLLVPKHHVEGNDSSGDTSEAPLQALQDTLSSLARAPSISPSLSDRITLQRTLSTPSPSSMSAPKENLSVQDYIEKRNKIWGNPARNLTKPKQPSSSKSPTPSISSEAVAETSWEKTKLFSRGEEATGLEKFTTMEQAPGPSNETDHAKYLRKLRENQIKYDSRKQESNSKSQTPERLNIEGTEPSIASSKLAVAMPTVPDTTKSFKDLVPCEDIYLSLPLESSARELYSSIFLENKGLLRNLGHARATREDPDVETQLSRATERMFDACSHMDLVENEVWPDGDMTESTQAEWATTVSSKCSFLKSFLLALSGSEKHFKIYAKPGRTMEILETFLRGSGLTFSRPDNRTSQQDGQVLLIELLATDANEYVTTRADLVIGFDDTFDPQAKHVKQIRRSLRGEGLCPALCLVVHHSIEHIARKAKLAPAGSAFAGLVPAPNVALALTANFYVDKAGSALPDEPSAQALGEVAADLFQEERLEQLPSVFQHELQVHRAISAPMQYESRGESPLKRTIEGVSDDEGGDTSKRLRQSPRDVDNGVSAEVDASAASMAAPEDSHMADMAVERLPLNTGVAVRPSLAEAEAMEGALRREMVEKDSLLKNLEMELGKLQSRFEEKSKENNNLRGELTRVQSVAEKSNARLEKSLSTSNELRAERNKLAADSGALRDALRGSNESEAARIIGDLSEKASRVDGLEKRVESVKNELEFVRQNYQEASAAAKERADEAAELRSEIEELRHKASEQATTLRTLFVDSTSKAQKEQIKQLEAENSESKRALTNAQDEIRLLKQRLEQEERRAGMSLSTRSSSLPVQEPVPAAVAATKALQGIQSSRNLTPGVKGVTARVGASASSSRATSPAAGSSRGASKTSPLQRAVRPAETTSDMD